MLLNNGILVVGIIFIWLSVLTFLLVKVGDHFRRLTRDVSKKDLISLLEKILANAKIEKERTDKLLKKLTRIETESLGFIQKVGLVRFNPFAETGGDQSFCLALLDGKDNGLVISSLHSRGATRIFAKPVKGSKEAGYPFSEEESKAIIKAKKIS